MRVAWLPALVRRPALLAGRCLATRAGSRLGCRALRTSVDAAGREQPPSASAPAERDEPQDKLTALLLCKQIEKLAQAQPLEALATLRTVGHALDGEPLSHAVRATMAALTAHGRMRLAIDLYEEAVTRHGLRPNSYVLLQLCVAANKGRSKGSTADRSQAKRVVQLLMAAVGDGALLEAPALSAAVQACAQAAASESALALFTHALRESRAHLDERHRMHMRASALAACARARDSPRALAVHELAEAEGVDSDLACFNALLNALGRSQSFAGHLEQAVAIFEQALALDERLEGTGKRGLDVVTLNSVVSAAARARRANLAFELQRRAAARGVQPNGVTITALMLACCRDPAELDGRRALRTMRASLARGLRPDALALRTLERAVLERWAAAEPAAWHDGAEEARYDEAAWEERRRGAADGAAALDELAAELGAAGWSELVATAEALPAARPQGSRAWLAARVDEGEGAAEAESRAAAAGGGWHVEADAPSLPSSRPVRETEAVVTDEAVAAAAVTEADAEVVAVIEAEAEAQQRRLEAEAAEARAWCERVDAFASALGLIHGAPPAQPRSAVVAAVAAELPPSPPPPSPPPPSPPPPLPRASAEEVQAVREMVGALRRAREVRETVASTSVRGRAAPAGGVGRRGRKVLRSYLEGLSQVAARAAALLTPSAKRPRPEPAVEVRSLRGAMTSLETPAGAARTEGRISGVSSVTARMAAMLGEKQLRPAPAGGAAPKTAAAGSEEEAAGEESEMDALLAAAQRADSTLDARGAAASARRQDPPSGHEDSPDALTWLRRQRKRAAKPSKD